MSIKEDLPTIAMEKKIYKKLEHMDRDIESLMRAHYSVISTLVPAAKPTKREMELFRRRSKERTVPLEKIEKRLGNG